MLYLFPRKEIYMASVKVVLRQKKDKHGMFPLAIRITKDRTSSFMHLGQHIKESDWDDIKQRVKKSHPNSTRLNNYLIKKLSEANDKLLELEVQKKGVSSKAVKQGLKPTGNDRSFFTQASIYLENLKKSGKYKRWTVDKPYINRFREFLKNEDIIFEDITVNLLNRFKAYLKATRKVNERTVVNHLVILRSIYNQAIKGSIVDRKHYPFGKDKIRIKFPDSLRIGLTPEEVKRIEDLQLDPSSYLNHARNIWLLSFYFAGMRVSDVLRLKWSDFQNERLHYSMGKNAKGGSLKIPEKAQKILNPYESQKRNNDDLVFPELKVVSSLNDMYQVQLKIASAVGRLDRYLRQVGTLAEIDKKLTMHIARHTFGNISGDKIPIQMLQKLYRHTSITTTIGYQANFIHKDTDDALDAVVSF